MNLLLILASIVVATLVHHGSPKFVHLYNCRQSSDAGFKHRCAQALDTTPWIREWSKTAAGDSRPFWEARLSRPSQVTYIRVMKEYGIMTNPPRDFYVLLDNEICGNFSNAAHTNHYFDLYVMCEGNGTVLTIQSNIPEPLQLGWVTMETLENSPAVRLQKPIKLPLKSCRQSSDYEEYTEVTVVCSGAIDGEVAHSWLPKKMSHTKSDRSAFWEVQMDWDTIFTAIRILNRQDCCQERLSKLSIKADGYLCLHYNQGPFRVKRLDMNCVTDKGLVKFDCLCHGSTLRIEKDDVGFLNLAEVEAFGIPKEPNLLSQYEPLHLHSCRQISDNNGASCTGAIDGNIYQTFSPKSASQTNEHLDPWWEARTLKPSNIMRVKIFNRMDAEFDRLTNFEISVDDNRCVDYDGSFFSVWTFNCNRFGSLLTIQSRRKTPSSLTLIEVQAFGMPLAESREPVP